MRHPVFWQFLATLVIVALFLRFFWYLAAAIGLAVVIWWCARAWRRYQARIQLARQRDAEIAARADRQNLWVEQGDERGVYGQYPPPRDT